MDKLFKDHLSNELCEHIVSISPLSGGDINHAARIETEHKSYFIKWNNHPDAFKMFQSETFALELMSKTKTIAIPQIINCSTFNNQAYLILQYIPTDSSRPNKEDFYLFGAQLAVMHKVKCNYFGYEEDNYTGTLNQPNSAKETWSDFYITQRLQIQLDLAKKQSYLSNLSIQFIDKFYLEIGELLHDQKPSLLHGDLWNGNYIIGENGTAFLIDPASYYGHREVDLAMSELFGGFGTSFYDGYNDTYKISQDYKFRKEIYQLYFLLVHLNLFGRSYEESCFKILTKFE